MEEDAWKATLSRYYDDLGKYEPGELARACEIAPRAHPAFFPALGQLIELADTERKLGREAAKSMKLLDEPRDDEEGKKRVREIINSLSEKVTL